jgi:hypothetical protein
MRAIIPVLIFWQSNLNETNRANLSVSAKLEGHILEKFTYV